MCYVVLRDKVAEMQIVFEVPCSALCHQLELTLVSAMKRGNRECTQLILDHVGLVRLECTKHSA